MTFEELLKITVSEDLIRMVFSKPLKGAFSSKVKVRPVVIKKETLFQVTSAIGSKDENTYKEVHENLGSEELIKKIKTFFPGELSQALIETNTAGYTVLAGKKGNITIRKNASVSAVKADTDHNRSKNYLLPENEKIPFMADLGVMTPEGKIVKSRYDKYRQLNRYLEFINDVVDRLPKDREITIVDFGCGKSYLTFALYYFLAVKNNRRVKIVGLDLKTDVINECNRLKNKYGYNGLTFIKGDIEHYEGDAPDMVISLHACDTATDHAIYKGILWNASVIMAVPCCQHELNKKIKSDELSGVLGYGILKDRLSAIVTDAMRANLLKEWGYDTQILEFIDMEHTPKNILIRAVRKTNKITAFNKNDNEKEERLKALVGADITLERLLNELKEKNEADNT